MDFDPQRPLESLAKLLVVSMIFAAAIGIVANLVGN